MDRRLGADIVARSRLVLDDELLAEPLRQPLPHDARRDVGGAAGGIGDDPAHRPGRIIERGGVADAGEREAGQAHRENTSKIHAWLHGVSLLLAVLVARTIPLRSCVSFANLRMKVRGNPGIAQGRSPGSRGGLKPPTPTIVERTWVPGVLHLVLPALRPAGARAISRLLECRTPVATGGCRRRCGDLCSKA